MLLLSILFLLFVPADSGTNSGGDGWSTGAIIGIVAGVILVGLIVLACCIVVCRVVCLYASKSKRTTPRTQCVGMQQISNMTTSQVPMTDQALPAIYPQQTSNLYTLQPGGYPAQYPAQPQVTYSVQDQSLYMYPNQGQGGVYPDQEATLYQGFPGVQATLPPPHSNPEFHQPVLPSYNDIQEDSKAPCPMATNY